jgi:hypothetical protein
VLFRSRPWLLEAGIVVLAGIALRLPFLTETAWNARTARIATAILDPSAPYPPSSIAAVTLGHALHRLIADPVSILVAVGLVLGALAASVLYLVVRALAGPWPARTVAAIALAFPLLWHAGATGTSQPRIALASALLGLALLARSSQRLRRFALPIGALAVIVAAAIPWELAPRIWLPGTLLVHVLWLVPFGAAGLWALFRRPELEQARSPLLLWILVAALYFVLRRDIGGVVALVMPCLALAALSPRALPALGGRVLLGARVATGVAIAALALVFLLGSDALSASSIPRHDALLKARVAFVRSSFVPETTVLLGRGAVAHARYYLPEFRITRLAARNARVLARLRLEIGRATTAVWLDDSWQMTGVPVTWLTVPDGGQIGVSEPSVIAAALAGTAGLRDLPEDDDSSDDL